MPSANRRLSVELDRALSLINREVMNPILPELTVNDIKPIMQMVAHARAEYLKELCDVSEKNQGETPSLEHVKRLRLKREIFEELVAAYQALDTAIERGYIDVEAE